MQLKYFLYIDNVASMLQLFKKKFFYFYFYSALSQEGITYLSTELRTISFRVKSRKLNVNKRVWICVNSFLQGVEKGVQEIQLILVPTRGSD